MGGGVLHAVVRLARKLARPRAERDAPDRQLLERFVASGDQSAFAALVERHGPMVLGLCRRVLHNDHDAEDAFQAAFLVLVKKGRSIARPELLGNWLYGVAYRTAVKARVRRARQQARERQARLMPSVQPQPAADWTDLRLVLDEEIHRLPDKYRTPLVLCYVEGKSNEEAARLLGCPIGTVQSRLARARDRLRACLTRRGLALSPGFLAAGATIPEAAAAVPAALAAAALQAAVLVAGGNAVAVVPPQVFLLMKGVLRAMFLTRMLQSAGLVLLLATLGGAALFAFQALARDKAGPPLTHKPEAIPANAAKPGPPKSVDWTAPRTWVSLPAEADKTAPILRDLVAAKDQLFAVGDRGTFYQYRDGKVTRIASPTEERLNVVWGLTPEAVYAAGDKGVVVHFDGTTLKIVGQPLAIVKRTHHPSIKPYDTPVRLDALWASSPRDIYAGGPGILVHYDGRRWQEVDIGAGQVIVPTSTRLTRGVATPMVGPIWGTAPDDVWVRREQKAILGAKGEPPVVMHFNGKSWSQTKSAFPADRSQVDLSGVLMPQLSFSGGGIWAHFDSFLHRWQRNQWQREISLPGRQCGHWTTLAPKTALAFKSAGGKTELFVFANDRWQTIPGPPMLLRSAPRRLAVTEDGVIGCLFYGDEGVWKGASVARMHLGKIKNH